MMKKADMALYSAKADGAGNYRLFEPEMQAWALRRRALEDGLRSAIANNELYVVFQPVVDLSKRAIVSCYAKTLAEIHGLAGEATVAVELGEGGAVKSAKTKDAAAEALGKCVEEAAKATKFDKANASDTIKARFALI